MGKENKFMDEAKSTHGEIRISPNVIESITRINVLETDGVVELNGNFTSEIADFLHINNSIKGIKARMNESEVQIETSIIVKNGYSIPELAERVQQSIKNSIETMTGLSVTEVNVHIDGIVI